jgi:hypothetical protein
MDSHMKHAIIIKTLGILLGIATFGFAITASAQETLFEMVGPPSQANLPAHVSRSQSVRINRRALQMPSLKIDLFGDELTAIRDRIERHKAGQLVWVGHLQGNPGNTVIVTLRGNAVSALIQNGASSYRIGVSSKGQKQLYEIDLATLPPDDADSLPDGNSSFEKPTAVAEDSVVAADTITQDLLVVYTQGACNYVNSCDGLEADIVTAVADINTAYVQSGINITMNLVGMGLTQYTGTNASQALSDLRGTSDSQMNEVHTLRDQLAADIVSLIYDGAGCGIGYLGSNASSAFSVTDVPCLVGNRTMAHEIGHNQGAYHDRTTVGGGTSGAYNYGYRRCSDGTSDDFGSPYFRTVLSYACSSAPRVGRFSNPNVNYLGVPQGVDPAINPEKGAYNVRTLNESATYVAGFRVASTSMPPSAPTDLLALATGQDTIVVSWTDTADNEDSFSVQRSLDGSSWSTVATLGANQTAYDDNGLLDETRYYYRANAVNTFGASAYSNVYSDTTEPLPTSIDDVAYGESPQTGLVNGSYVSTQIDDSTTETITEQNSGGEKRFRTQLYTHTWLFNVAGGTSGAVLTANAWVSCNEGANFYYSDDGGSSWNLMFTIDENSPLTLKTYALPTTIVGEVRVQARDAAQSVGESVDQLIVDYLVITSYTTSANPPAAPSEMTITGVTSNTVSLSFNDNADNEFGFSIWRSATDPGGVCSGGSNINTLGSSSGTGLVTSSDATVVSSSNYWYWATAFNGGGNSACSNIVQATTDAASLIMTANGYKVKGKHIVDLTWAGITALADIYRDSLLIKTTNDVAYTDNIGAKGGATYDYKVCEQGSTTVCSTTVNVVF